MRWHRRNQVWEAVALRAAPQLLRDAPVLEDEFALPEATEGEAVLWDYNATALTLRRHPLAILRPRLDRHRLMTAEQLHPIGNGVRVRTCGIVTLRQQPDPAKGTIFVSLEDETGTIQVICWPKIKEQQRDALMKSRLLAVQGMWQREGKVRNLIAHRLRDMTPLLGRLGTESRDFH